MIMRAVAGALPVLCFQLVLFVTQAGAAEVASRHPEPVAATMLLYQEQEPGADTYPLRMLITEDFVRSDDGVEAASFLLYDRRDKVLYSVSREERRSRVIQDTPFDRRLPETLRFEDQLSLAQEAPRIDGRPVYAYSLLSDGNVCQQSMVVPGFLAEAGKAIIEVRDLLAARQYRDLDKTPEELRTACFLANYVYAPGRNLERGFAVQESNNAGLHRLLVDYKLEFNSDPRLFELPAGYEQYTLP
jgi:hypothetical protein